MSCNEWEAGTIKIPSKDWPTFRKAVINAWNEFHLDLLRRAEDAYKELKDAPKPQPNSFQTPFWEWTQRVRLDEDRAWAMDSLLHERDEVSKERKLRRPLKANLPLKPVSAGTTLSFGETTIRLDDATRTVVWSVSENNHACERARHHPVAQALFGLLNRITWGRGSGGTIVGNNEYSRDSRDEGGGGNYVVQRFGKG